MSRISEINHLKRNILKYFVISGVLTLLLFLGYNQLYNSWVVNYYDSPVIIGTDEYFTENTLDFIEREGLGDSYTDTILLKAAAGNAYSVWKPEILNSRKSDLEFLEVFLSILFVLTCILFILLYRWSYNWQEDS